MVVRTLVGDLKGSKSGGRAGGRGRGVIEWIALFSMRELGVVCFITWTGPPDIPESRGRTYIPQHPSLHGEAE